MKPGIRVLAIDDSPLVKKKVRCIAILARVDRPWEGVEGALSFFVTKDGRDSTEKITSAVKASPFKDQVRVVLTHTITLAGFNVIDTQRLSRELGVPVICVTRKKPDEAKVLAALKNFRDWKRRLKFIENAREIKRIDGLWYYRAGVEEREAKTLLKRFRGYPWPLRLAHIVASAVEKGFSAGRP